MLILSWLKKYHDNCGCTQLSKPLSLRQPNLARFEVLELFLNLFEGPCLKPQTFLKLLFSFRHVVYFTSLQRFQPFRNDFQHLRSWWRRFHSRSWLVYIPEGSKQANYANDSWAIDSAHTKSLAAKKPLLVGLRRDFGYSSVSAAKIPRARPSAS